MKSATLLFILSAFGVSLAGEPRIAPTAEAAASKHSMNVQETPLAIVLDLYAELTGRPVFIHPVQRHVLFTHKTERISAKESVKAMEDLFAKNHLTFTEGPSKLLVFHPDSVKLDLPKGPFAQPSDAAADSKHALNFQATPMKFVLGLYEELTKESVLVEPSKKWSTKTVTFRERAPVSAKEAIDHIETILHLSVVHLEKKAGEILVRDLIKGHAGPAPRSLLVAPSSLQTVKPARKSPAEVHRHLQEYQMEVIRKGLPLLPQALDPAKIEQLKKEGFLGEPPRSAPESGSGSK